MTRFPPLLFKVVLPAAAAGGLCAGALWLSAGSPEGPSGATSGPPSTAPNDDAAPGGGSGSLERKPAVSGPVFDPAAEPGPAQDDGAEIPRGDVEKMRKFVEEFLDNLGQLAADVESPAVAGAAAGESRK